MRRLLMLLALGLVLTIIVLPAVIVKSCRYPDTSPADRPAPGGGIVVRVLVHTTGDIVSLPLEEYVAGVVAAEMPTSFELEALKAQAVIARTFTACHLRSMGGQGVKDNPGADITTDIWSGGQAWMSKAEARREWGWFGFYSRWTRVEEAVNATAGLVLTHNGVPIEAAYHSTCGGATENSEDVWSEAVPYLRGVDCDWCAHSQWTEVVTEVTVGAMAKALGLDAGVLSAGAGQGRTYLEVTSVTPSGRAKTVRVGELVVRGLEFRRALGLRSVRFTHTAEGDVIRFVTSGYGHGVGLCQYGADGMARSGRDFREILDHYYTDVELESLNNGF